MGRYENRQQRKQSNSIRNRLKSKGILKKLAVAGIAIALIGLVIVNVLIWNSDISKLNKPAPQPTVIYDQNGVIASKISSSKIEGVSIEQIPDDVIHAVIATEDQRFYKHNGINYIAIMKAFFKNAVSGDIVAGGSTITQQLAKNVFLTQDRTYSRKLKEFILSKKIERTYSKDEILERYLNQIYFGEGAWGIQRAAQVYFGKDVSDLSLSEAATLAGLIKAPSALSPVKDMDKSMDRREVVLSLMKKEGYISQTEEEKAIGQSIELAAEKVDDYKGKYPYYVDHIIEEAINKYHLTENEILSGGMQIYTELSPTIQKSVENAYQNDNLFPESQPDQLIQSGAIFIDPSTGGIKALVGGRGEHTYRGFNRATQLQRQPGSTMKPLAAYTPALEQGYDTFDILEDQPINIDGYQPQNYDRQFHGQVTMYDAVIHSYNIPPVWVLNKIGLQHGIEAVDRFGIPLDEQDYNLGLALGGLNKGTSPLQMAQAFSTFANNGVMNEAHSIQKIVDANGELLVEWNKKETQVTDPIVAQKMTYMLQGVVKEGTGVKAQANNWDIAGKTGTTELPFASNGGAKDHWFVGYTSHLVGAVWLGYDQTDTKHYLTGSSAGTATVVFQQILSQLENEGAPKPFDLLMIEKKYKQEMNLKIQREEKAKKEEFKKQEQAKREAEKQLRKEKKEEWKEQRKKEKERNKEEKNHGKKNKHDEDDDDEDDDD